MRRLLPALLLPTLLLAACTTATATADIPAAYLAPQWRLVDLNGVRVGVPVTIDLSFPGQVSGRAPCNHYSGRYDGTLPEFRPGPLRATEMACDALQLEDAFFRAMATVNRAEVQGTSLIVTGDSVRMEFVRPVE